MRTKADIQHRIQELEQVLKFYEKHLTEWDFKPKEALFQELAMLLNRPLETKR